MGVVTVLSLAYDASISPSMRWSLVGQLSAEQRMYFAGPGGRVPGSHGYRGGWPLTVMPQMVAIDYTLTGGGRHYGRD